MTGTGEQSDQPASRARRGRPLGARNKIGRDARQLLATEGLAAVQVACRIAAGRVLTFRDIDPDTGRRRRLVPTAGDMAVAQKLVIERLVPLLKAEELTGKDGRDLFQSVAPEPKDSRSLAMGILEIIRKATQEPEKPAGAYQSGEPREEASVVQSSQR